MSTINELITQHITNTFHAKTIQQLTEQFSRCGMVKIPNIVSEELKKTVHKEIRALLENEAERRDLTLKTTDNTPRHLSVVRSERILEKSKMLCAIRESEALLTFLSSIAEDQFLTAVSEDEKFVITKQEFKGDTHGWHWGDYAYALIWLVEMPPVNDGGMLQCIPHTRWNKTDPNTNQYLCDNPISTYSFVSGDIYLLKADTTLHRTVPLNKDVTRIMLNMTWANKNDLGKASLLFDDRWWDNKNASEALHV